MKRFLFSFIVAWVSISASDALAHPMARMHEADMEGVFSRIAGESFRNAVNDLSRAMDNELAESFRREFGPIPGNHRLIGHGWTLDGAIPKNVLRELDKAIPGRKSDIVKWWGQKTKILVARMRDATGLPSKQAQALAGLHWDLHLLGDRTADNTLVDHVLPTRDIERNLEKNCEILFKGRDGYAKAVRSAMRETLAKGGTDAEQAARLIQCLQNEVPFSEMLSRRWGRTLAVKGIRILPRGAGSITTESFLKRFSIAVPESFAAEAAKAKAKSTEPDIAQVRSGTAKGSPRGGVRAANRAVRAFGATLPVVIETGFFFYDERKNRDAFEAGDRTAEEMQCVTYENVGRHGAALALGSVGAWVGGTYGAGIGTVEPGGGNVVGGFAGGLIGGIAGGIAGEFGGQAAGERMYVSKAEKNAERGDPAAMFFLGGYHYKRIRPGREDHVKESIDWLTRAATATNGAVSKATVYLGQLAWAGIGQTTNRVKAVELWTMAAEKGDSDAMYLLACALLVGDGTEQDIEKGRGWMSESAARGCELALDAYPETDSFYNEWLSKKNQRTHLNRLRFTCGLVAVFVLFTVLMRRRHHRKRE